MLTGLFAFGNLHRIPCSMERTYEITPEMLGLTWPHLLRQLVKECVVLLLGICIFSYVFHEHSVKLLSEIGSVIFIFFLINIFGAPSSKLRVTDDCIEEVGGPIIRRHAVISVKEQDRGTSHGIEVAGRRERRWLPKYKIFIPSALPEFEEIKQMALTWQAAQEHLVPDIPQH